MARVVLIKDGKILKDGTRWSVDDEGEISVLTPCRIGEHYQILDLDSLTIQTVKVVRKDGTGAEHDLIDHQADGTWEDIPDPSPNSDDKALRLGDYLPIPATIWDPPLTLDYKKGLSIRLRRKNTFVKGELQKVEYYSGASIAANGTITYVGDPIIREDITYVRDSLNLALSRELVITWLCKDGTDHPTTKTMAKVYSHAQRSVEGKRRRSNVVDDLEIITAGLLIETELANNGNDVQATVEHGRNLMATYSDSITGYLRAGLKDIITDIEDDATYTWLDNTPASLGGATTIRAVLKATLDIWS